jgi:flagellar basal body-associated protein FliL
VVETIWSIIALLATIAVLGGVGYAMLTGRHDREHEEEAREFFDRHGHWPDEDPTN